MHGNNLFHLSDEVGIHVDYREKTVIISVKPPSLGILKTRLDAVLCNLL